MTNEKEYVVVYKSLEHMEVLGYVKSTSIEKAIELAQTKLLPEAKYYEVSEAEISEISTPSTITFDLNS
jgi:hypothetical protein